MEVVAWLPNWVAVKQERDPETGLIFRQTYGQPLERTRSVAVEPQALVETNFVLSK